MTYKAGVIDVPGATGNQSTDVGFAPTGVLFFASGRSAAGAGDGTMIWMTGAADGTNQWCQTISQADAQGVSNIWRYQDDAVAVMLLNTSGTTIATATCTFSGNNIVLNWTTVTSGYDVGYLAFGGDVDCLAGVTAMNTASPGNQVITTTGVDVKAVIAAHMLSVTADVSSSTNAVASIGIGDGTDNHVSMIAVLDGQGTMDTARRGNASDMVSVSGLAGGSSPTTRAQTAAVANGSFTINITDNPATADRLLWLAIGGAITAKVVSFTSPASTGNQAVTTTGVDPDAVLLISHAAPAEGVTAVNTDHGRIAIGAGDGTSSITVAVNNQDNVADSSVQTYEATNRVIGYLDADNLTAATEDASLSSFGTGQFTLNWATVDATARSIGALVVQDNAGVSGAIASSIQPLTSAFTGTHAQSGTIAASVQPLTAALTGTMHPDGAIASSIPPLTSSLTGTQTQSGAIASSIQPLTASLSGTVTAVITGAIASSIQPLTASLSGLSEYRPIVLSGRYAPSLALDGRYNPIVALAGRAASDVALTGRHAPDVALDGRYDPAITLEA